MTLTYATLTYADRNTLYKMYEHNANVIDIIGKPEQGWTSPKEGDINLYGVELECTTDYEPKHIIDAFPELFAICKKDGSISGNKANKIEIVTVPASMRRQKMMWASFFKSLNEDMFDTLDKHTNGMHIHIDRQAFDKDILHLKKFCYFFTGATTAEFLFEISERDRESLQQYAKMVKAKNLAGAERAIMQGAKYTAVNLGKGPTVEVRIFKGIVSQTSVFKNIEFVDSIVEFTRLAPMKDVNLAMYLKWLDALPNTKYRILRMCLEEMGTKNLVVISGVQNVMVTKGAAETVRQLNAGVHKVTPEMAPKIIEIFNLQFTANGMSIKYDGEKYTLVKEGTRFAKFDEKVAGMFLNWGLAA